MQVWGREDQCVWFERGCQMLLNGGHNCWKHQSAAEFIWLSIADSISDRNT